MVLQIWQACLELAFDGLCSIFNIAWNTCLADVIQPAIQTLLDVFKGTMSGGG